MREDWVDVSYRISLALRATPTQMPANLESRLKLCRVLVGTYLLTLPGMILGVEQIVGRALQPLEIPPQMPIFIAIGALTFGFWSRIQFVSPAARALRANPESGALPRWQVGQLSAATCAEWIALSGMLWRLQGGSLKSASFFYVTAFALLLLWFPRRP
jgi:hypothetical protein